MHDFQAIHSDILMHWTGRDIDERRNTTDWLRKDVGGCPPKMEDAHEDEYLQRLQCILTHGLWMTPPRRPDLQTSGDSNIARTCFTELKLSQSREHASHYGRLGIGLKRYFLFNRGGRPVVYYGGTIDKPEKHDPLRDAHKDDPRLSKFFLPMSRGPLLRYDLYSESEWRIVEDCSKRPTKDIVDPSQSDSPAHSYWQQLPSVDQAKCRRVIPMNKWLAVIIYPSLRAKWKAQEPNGPIRQQILKLKGRAEPNGKMGEDGNLPVEIDLDLCKQL